MSCDLRRPHSYRAPPLITTHLHTICTVFLHTLPPYTAAPPLSPNTHTHTPLLSYQIPRQNEESVGCARLRASAYLPAFPADSCAFLITTVTPASASGQLSCLGPENQQHGTFSRPWEEDKYSAIIYFSWVWESQLVYAMLDPFTHSIGVVECSHLDLWVVGSIPGWAMPKTKMELLGIWGWTFGLLSVFRDFQLKKISSLISVWKAGGGGPIPSSPMVQEHSCILNKHPFTNMHIHLQTIKSIKNMFMEGRRKLENLKKTHTRRLFRPEVPLLVARYWNQPGSHCAADISAVSPSLAFRGDW